MSHDESMAKKRRSDFPFIRIVLSSNGRASGIVARQISTDGMRWESAGEVDLVADERPAPPVENGRGSH